MLPRLTQGLDLLDMPFELCDFRLFLFQKKFFVLDGLVRLSEQRSRMAASDLLLRELVLELV